MCITPARRDSENEMGKAKECDEMVSFNYYEDRAKPIGTESAEPAALEWIAYVAGAVGREEFMEGATEAWCAESPACR